MLSYMDTVVFLSIEMKVLMACKKTTQTVEGALVLSKPVTVQHSSTISVSQIQSRTSGHLQKLCVQRDISETTSLTHKINKN